MTSSDNPWFAGAVQTAANAAATAANRAIDASRGDNDIVTAAMKAAALEIGFIRNRMTPDSELHSKLRFDSRNREVVFAGVRIALHAANVGGALPADRADSLYAAFEQFIAAFE